MSGFQVRRMCRRCHTGKPIGRGCTTKGGFVCAECNKKKPRSE